MKKTLFAAVLAIACIGAFAFKSSVKDFTFYYDDGNGNPITYTVVSPDPNPCPGGTVDCIVTIGGVPRQLFTNQDLADAHKAKRS